MSWSREIVQPLWAQTWERAQRHGLGENKEFSPHGLNFEKEFFQ
jgi:hypothetical protein